MAAIAILAALQILAFSGCNSKSASSKYATPATPQYSADAGLDGSGSAAGSTASATSSKASSSSLDTSDVSKADTERKIIMSASLSLQTTGYDKTISDLEALVTSYGGFVQDSSTQGTGVNKSDKNRTASYTVRVPSDKLNDFISNVGSVGKLVSRSVKGEDVSKNYYDTQTELKTLNAEEARVLDIMKNTTDMSDMLTAEQRLSDIDNQINQLTGELQQWDSLVDLSTVTITIDEVSEISTGKNSFGRQLGTVLTDSLHALVKTLEVLMQIILAILPFAIVFGAVAALIIFLVKLIRKHTKKPPQNPDEPTP